MKRNILLLGAVATTLATSGFASSDSRTAYVVPKVNTAVEQRQDPFWAKAQEEVSTGAQSPSQGVLPVLTRGSGREKTISLTFDDGPHPGWTEKLLGVLNQENVPATFFVVGKQVEKYPELIKAEFDAGHLVENHTFSHVTLTKIPESDVNTEYRACSDLIEQITGTRPRFARPPGGDSAGAVIRGALANGLTTVMWTDDPGDYAHIPAEVVVQRTMSHLHPGAIVLLHDGMQNTIDALPAIIKQAKAAGYRFVSLTQLEAEGHRRAA